MSNGNFLKKAIEANLNGTNTVNVEQQYQLEVINLNRAKAGYEADVAEAESNRTLVIAHAKATLETAEALAATPVYNGNVVESIKDCIKAEQMVALAKAELEKVTEQHNQYVEKTKTALETFNRAAARFLA